MALHDHKLSSTLSQATGLSGENLLCDECDVDDPDAAVVYCRSCRLKLCDLHASAHRKSRRSKHHRLGVVEEAKQRGEESFCRLHGLVLDLYCETCRRVVCVECAMRVHSRHTMAAWTEELADQVCQRLEQFVQQGKTETVRLLETMSKEARKRKRRVSDNAKTTSDKIFAHFDELRQGLAEQQEELLESLARQQKNSNKPFERIDQESMKLLRSSELVHSLAEEAISIGDKRVKAGKEGVVSRRLELIARRALQVKEGFSNICAQHVTSEFFVFRPSRDACLKRRGFVGALASNAAPVATRICDRQVKLKFNVYIKKGTGVDEAGDEELKSVADDFAFYLSPSEEVMAAVCADLADSFQHACTVVQSTVQLSRQPDRVDLDVVCTLRCDGAFGDGGNILIKLQSEIFGRCVLHQACQQDTEWRFERAEEGCPPWVKLSADRRNTSKTKQTHNYDQIVGDTEISSGVHMWKAEILADSEKIFLLAGVTTLKKHGKGVGVKHFTGWENANWTSGVKCKAIFEGRYTGQVWVNARWNRRDILFFELDFGTGALTVTNLITRWSDTIHGITGHVRPCFGLYCPGQGVRLLPCLHSEEAATTCSPPLPDVSEA